MTEILLKKTYAENGKYLGKIAVDKEDFTKKMSELWSDEDLTTLAKQSVIPLAALKQMTWIAFLKSDIAGKDIQGYKKYKNKLKEERFDV